MKARRLKKKEKIKRKAKRFIVPIIIMILIILLIVGIIIYIDYCKTNGTSIIFQKYSSKQNNPGNVSEELLKEKEFEGMQIKEISIKKEDGIVYFSASIENNTEQSFESKEVRIKFINENNKPIANFKTKIETIAPNEAVNMQLSTSMDITKAYDFIIE